MSAKKPAPRSRRRLFLVATFLSALTLGVTAYYAFREPPRAPVVDPRLSFATPFLNVRPEVQYVGDEACASCHSTIVESFRQHSMGRSLAPVAAAEPVERYAADAGNPLSVGSLRYTVERRGDQMLHREEFLRGGKPVTEVACDVAYAVGSGRRGRSYLLATDGFIFQSPLTWYPQRNAWDLSPGYESGNEHFDRPVDRRCLFCHTNRVEPIAGTINRYRQPIFNGHAIGCERCHGPGGIHVERQERRDGIDLTIVNPKHLKPALRDAVCEQCHLEGKQRVARRGLELSDYRPGLPLEQFVSIYVLPPEREESLDFVGHVEQMHASRCFKASAGKMGCVSCHDPHRLPAPAERVAFYRQRCLECHAEKGCSVPVTERRQKTAEDSCMQCHLPAANTNIQHAAIADHRILRKPRSGEARPERLKPSPGTQPFRLFHDKLRDPKDPENDRDYGIAIGLAAELEGLQTLRAPAGGRRVIAQMMLPLLEPAARRDPQDWPAREAHAAALWMQDKTTEAAAIYQEVLRKAPERETALVSAAKLAQEMQRPAEAVALWRRAISVNPHRWSYHHQLGFGLVVQEDYRGAQEALREALRLHPISVETRKLLVSCALETGDAEGARAEYRLLLDLNPPDQQALDEWFARRTRELGLERK